VLKGGIGVRNDFVARKGGEVREEWGDDERGV